MIIIEELHVIKSNNNREEEEEKKTHIHTQKISGRLHIIAIFLKTTPLAPSSIHEVICMEI